MADNRLVAEVKMLLLFLSLLGAGYCTQSYIGHKDIFPNNKYYFEKEKIFIPDRNEIAPEDGKLLNFTYYPLTGSTNAEFMILALYYNNLSDSYTVSARSEWIQQETYVKEWKYVTFADYIKVYKGTLIGLHFRQENPMAYYPMNVGEFYGGYDDNTYCHANGTLEIYHATQIEYYVNDQIVSGNRYGVSTGCSFFSYYGYYISDSSCLTETLEYEYGIDYSTFSIDSYPIKRLNQAVHSDDSFCWTVTAPPRSLVSDDKQPVVALTIIALPTGGYEQSHPDGYTYCEGAGIEITDTMKNYSMFNICSATSLEWDKYFSITEQMTIRLTTGASWGDRFQGEVHAATEEDAPDGYYDQFDLDSNLEAWQIVLIVLGCVAFVVILIMICRYCSKKKDGVAPSPTNTTSSASTGAKRTEPSRPPAHLKPITPGRKPKLPPQPEPQPASGGPQPGHQPLAPAGFPSAPPPPLPPVGGPAYDPAYPHGPPPPYGVPPDGPYGQGAPPGGPPGMYGPPPGQAPPEMYGPPPGQAPAGQAPPGMYGPPGQAHGYPGNNNPVPGLHPLGGGGGDGEAGNGNSGEPTVSSKWKSTIPGPAVYNDQRF